MTTERIEAALGFTADRDTYELLDALEADKYEFREWFAEYKQARLDRLAFLEKRGIAETVYEPDDGSEYSDQPSPPVMREKWLDALEKNYGLPAAYVVGGTGETNLPRNKTAATEAAALRMENNTLKDRLIAALNDNKRLHEMLRLGNYTPPPPGENGAPIDTDAHGVQQAGITE